MSDLRKLSVFLCHASQDKPAVRELYQRLNAEGWIDPWLDEEKLKPGQTWTATIQDAIDSADSVIIFLSENSVNKEGFIQRELKRAWKVASEKPDNVIFLIPFRLEDCKVPQKLIDKQWGDYFGDSKEKTYANLIISLKQRHIQKLELEQKEQERVIELERDRKQAEKVIREQNLVDVASLDELATRQKEERIRRERVEAQLLAERAKWEEERKLLLRKASTEQQTGRSSSLLEKGIPLNEEAISRSFSPYSGSSIILDGYKIHFESLGHGRPVIFLHGWVGSWRYWFNSMQVASRSFRSYALDLWGFGDSPRNIKNYSLEKQSQLLELFLSEMGIGKVAIIGHGLGGLVGMTFAMRHPDSVDRLMTVSCPLDISNINKRLLSLSPLELSNWLSPRTPEAITALSDATKADEYAIKASLKSLQEENPFLRFRELKIPCFMIYGEKDPAVITDQRYFWELGGAYIYSKVLEYSGHFPMIDEPKTFETLMMRFLSLDSGFNPTEINY